MVERFTGSLFSFDARCLGLFVGNLCPVLLTEVFSGNGDSVIYRRKQESRRNAFQRCCLGHLDALQLECWGRGAVAERTYYKKSRKRHQVLYTLGVTKHSCLGFPGGSR